MNRYIFHGGCATQENETNRAFFSEVVKDIPNGGSLLLVYFASRDDNFTEKIESDTERFRGVAVSSINIAVATKENFINQVKEADAIYLRGGSTEKLINTLREYPDFERALKSTPKTVAGSSAGAYALSTYFSSHYEDIADQGLGIVPVRVVTHYKSEKMPPRAGAVEALKTTAEELPIIITEETQWSVFPS
jgi:peptidase E